MVELKLQKFRLSLVLNSFFFPLTSPDVFEVLKSREFEVGRIPEPFPSGARVYFSGRIARKRNVLVDIDNNRRLVGTDGVSIEDTIQTFSELLDMLREDFFVDLGEELSFVELIANYMIISDKNPLKVFQNNLKVTHGEEFRKILEIEPSYNKIAIVPKGVSPSSKKWLEISISPRLTMPSKAYWMEAIFRDASYDTVVTFARNLNSTVNNIIGVIERE